ncbi:MAG: Fe-S protein assembly co-chaperone HscB [Saprospiraceae bacterium]
MNYFEFFEIPVTFFLDEADLKRRFYQNSKKFHPDFYTLHGEEKQAEILEQSTINNEAYSTLSDFDRRMKYVLELKGMLAEEDKNTLPQDFLMEMMDINEGIMALELESDTTEYARLHERVKNIEEALFNDILPTLERYDDGTVTPEELESVKEFYLKKRYLLRILENLDRFAPASKEVGKS